jgi:hypothetical protein
MQVPFFIRSFLFIQVFFLLGSFTFHLINLFCFICTYLFYWIILLFI